jgi:hypothetical protein
LDERRNLSESVGGRAHLQLAGNSRGTLVVGNKTLSLDRGAHDRHALVLIKAMGLLGQL